MATKAYRPLNLDEDEIRLLILHPSRGDRIVEVDIVYAFLKDWPEYEALSYVWGDPTVTAPVRLHPLMAARLSASLVLSSRQP